MSSLMTKQENSSDIRNQAATSVAQDMSSARLRILGDLMDVRKRAEAHEQDFLRIIHSENAAFSKIISLFEESVQNTAASIVSVRAEFNDRVSNIFNDVNLSRESLSSGLNIWKKELSKEMDLTKEILRTSLETIHSQLAKRDVLFDADRDKRLEEISELRIQFEEDISRISSEHLESKQSFLHTTEKLHEDVRLLSSKMDAIVIDMNDYTDRQLKVYKKMMEERECQLVDRFDARLDELEVRIQRLVEDKIAMSSKSTETEFISTLKNHADSVRSRIDEDIQDITTKLESRFLSLENRIAEVTSNTLIPQDEITSLENRLCSILESSLSSRMTAVIDQIRDVDSRISARLSSQESALCALGSTGYFHEWTIADAKTKLESLGLFSSSNKFVSSESFSIGPYSNLQLRLYPLSSSLNKSPSVWLVHSPSGTDPNDLSLPVYVDLGIGRSKRSLCRMKKVQELFGHWVWEACGFDRDFIGKEVEMNGSLVVSVEISMRQWLKGDDAAHADGLPDSPMSAYTFAAGGADRQGSSTPHLPLRPMSTNPFEHRKSRHDDEKSALTPRRMSWAMFGEHADIDTAANTSNPFSR